MDFIFKVARSINQKTKQNKTKCLLNIYADSLGKCRFLVLNFHPSFPKLRILRNWLTIPGERKQPYCVQVIPLHVPPIEDWQTSNSYFRGWIESKMFLPWEYGTELAAEGVPPCSRYQDDHGGPRERWSYKETETNIEVKRTIIYMVFTTCYTFLVYLPYEVITIFCNFSPLWYWQE